MTMSAGKTRESQTVEDASPKAVAWPLDEKRFVENHTVEATDPEAQMNTEIMRLLDAEDRADAEKTSQEEEEAARAKEKADAEARACAEVAENARKKQEEAARVEREESLEGSCQEGKQIKGQVRYASRS